MRPTNLLPTKMNTCTCTILIKFSQSWPVENAYSRYVEEESPFSPGIHLVEGAPSWEWTAGHDPTSRLGSF